jgi:hypothetical protein
MFDLRGTFVVSTLGVVPLDVWPPGHPATRSQYISMSRDLVGMKTRHKKGDVGPKTVTVLESSSREI